MLCGPPPPLSFFLRVYVLGRVIHRYIGGNTQTDRFRAATVRGEREEREEEYRSLRRLTTSASRSLGGYLFTLFLRLIVEDTVKEKVGIRG